MKKILSLSLIAFVLLLSCDAKDSEVNLYSAGQDLTYFTDVNVVNTVVLTESSNPEFNIQVGSTIKTNVNRSYTVSVDPESTAIEGVHFTFNSSSVVIPAGEYVTDLVLNLDYLNVPNQGAVLILNLAGENVHEPRATYTLNISKLCSSFLEGEHSYVSTNLIKGDTGASCGSVSGTVVWTSLGDGNYSTSDASFGQFGSCWNDTPAVGPTFSHLCNSITVSSAPDQYGDTYTYTIVSVEGPVMVINWVNTYNDSGTATITREGGVDWQEELQTN